jgi:ribosomal protein S18 acetylase RimI-like enzyme
MWAEVRRSNHGALAFYQKTGFKIVGVIPNYYEDEDALIVQWPPSPPILHSKP